MSIYHCENVTVQYRGAPFNDGDFYKWMEAVIAVQAVEPDAEWDQRLDEIIQVIGQAQCDDGYIHTPVLIASRNGDPNAKPFADRFKRRSPSPEAVASLIGSDDSLTWGGGTHHRHVVGWGRIE